MRVFLPYGKGHLPVIVPDPAVLIQGKTAQPVEDVDAALRSALGNPHNTRPLSERVHPRDSVLILHTDGTRPTPNHVILPVILEELSAAGVSRESISLLNATGSHSAQHDEELAEMLGPSISGRYRTLQHNAYDDAGLDLAGTLKSGNRVYLNRMYMEADFRIATGFIEPHFFAGFSGGPKVVFPGIAGIESIMRNHSPENIGNRNATWGVTAGNPLWEEIAEAVRLVPPEFSLNVSLDAEKRITGVFAGELLAAHAEGCEFVREHSMARVDAPFDIVITTNSGHPLDRNLYQAVKGLSAAARITAPGGTIIMASACGDGLPADSCFSSLLDQFSSPVEALNALGASGRVVPDQWQVQVLAGIMAEHDVYLYSGGLTEGDMARAWMRRSPSVEETLELLLGRYGRRAKVCVLPEGPQVIPYLD